MSPNPAVSDPRVGDLDDPTVSRRTRRRRAAEYRAQSAAAVLTPSSFATAILRALQPPIPALPPRNRAGRRHPAPVQPTRVYAGTVPADEVARRRAANRAARKARRVTRRAAA